MRLSRLFIKTADTGGASYSITGAVTWSATPTSATAFGAAIAGSVTHTLAITSTLAYEAATGLNKARVSAMHFLKMYQPTPMAYD